MANNEEMVKMDPKKNAEIKKALLKAKIFEKASYTPYIGDGYKDAKEKVLFIGNSKYPADRGIIEDKQNQNFPKINYCSQIVSYCMQDLESLTTGRLGKKTIRVVKDFISQKNIELDSISFYNFYYDRFIPGVEIPNQGFAADDENLKRYQTALLTVVKKLRPKTIVCESSNLESQFDARSVDSRFFEGKSFIKWIEDKKIKDLTPSPKERFKKIAQEKDILNSSKNQFEWIREQLDSILQSSVPDDSDMMSLFKILNNESFKSIDGISQDKLKQLLRMMRILKRNAHEDISRLNQKEMVKLFLILDKKPFKQINQRNEKELREETQQLIRNFFEPLQKWNFYKLEKNLGVLSTILPKKNWNKKGLSGSVLKKSIQQMKQNFNEYADGLKDTELKEYIRPLFNKFIEEINKSSGREIESLHNLFKKNLFKEIFELGHTRFRCLIEIIKVFLIEKHQVNITSNIDDLKNEAFECIKELNATEMQKNKMLSIAEKKRENEDYKQVQKLEKKYFKDAFELSNANLKKRVAKYRKELEEKSLEMTLDDDEKKIISPFFVEIVLYLISKFDDIGLKRIIQVLIKHSLENISSRKFYEIMNLSTTICNEFPANESKKEFETSTYNQFCLFKCLKRMRILDSKIGILNATKNFEYMLDILEERNLFIAEPFIPSVLDYIEERYELSIPWIEKKQINFQDINNHLRGFSPIILNNDNKNKYKEWQYNTLANLKKEYSGSGFWKKLDKAYRDFSDNPKVSNKDYASLMTTRILKVPSGENPLLKLYDEDEKDSLIKKGYKQWTPVVKRLKK